MCVRVTQGTWKNAYFWFYLKGYWNDSVGLKEDLRSTVNKQFRWFWWNICDSHYKKPILYLSVLVTTRVSRAKFTIQVLWRLHIYIVEICLTQTVENTIIQLFLFSLQFQHCSNTFLSLFSCCESHLSLLLPYISGG